jgi:hypothetical protein
MGETMINAKVSELLGFVCHYLNDENTLAVIDTPFLFQDGDSIPVYVEQPDSKLRFFDDGEVIWHFMGRGVPLDEPGQSKFIADLAAPYGVALNGEGELEIWANAGQEPAAFARYISAMLAIVRWEEDQVAISEERWQQEVAADAERMAGLSA